MAQKGISQEGSGCLLPSAGDAMAETQSPKGMMQRGFSKVTVGGVRQSQLTLISTAVGGGVLSVSYVMWLCGIGLGCILLSCGAGLAYLTTIILMQLSVDTGKVTYSSLFAHCAGPAAGPILDFMLLIYGNGACISYFVFLGDFIPILLSLTSAPMWATGRTFAIIISGLVVAPVVVQKDASALRHVAPLSIVALLYVSVVIAAKTPSNYNSHFDDSTQGHVSYFKFNMHIFEAFSICLFAFNCHMNVVPVAAGLVRPTEARIRKVGARVNLLIVSFYLLVGVAGHVSFIAETPQDILNAYDERDIAVAIGRLVLSLTIFVALPLNAIPTAQSGLQLFGTLGKTLCRLPQHSESEVLPPVEDFESATPRASCHGDVSTEATNGTAVGTTLQPQAWQHAMMALLCLAVQVVIAIKVPGVATVISLLGATVATSMMLVIPAYCVAVAMPRTPLNRAKVVVLVAFALLGFASVPISIARAAGLLGP